MFLRDLFLNAYELYLKSPKSKSSLAFTTLAVMLIFAITASFEVCLSSSKLFFCALTFAAIQNFYFCVEKEINLDSGTNSLTWVNLCFIFLTFFYFYLNNNFVFFISVNVFFYVKMIKTWTMTITRISIAKNVFILLLTISSFQMMANITNLIIVVLGIPLSFAVWANQIEKYEKLTFMNHYLLFNLMFSVPLFFALTNTNDPMLFTWTQIAYTLLVIFIGSIAFNFAIKFVLANQLKHTLFVVNEFSIVYIAFCLQNWIIFIIAIILCAVSMHFVDFNFSDTFSDPDDEQLVAIEMTSVEFKTEKLLAKNTKENTVEMH